VGVIYLVEGPVGAGKSTFAGRLGLAHSAPHLNLDEWMATLFRPDRPQQEFLSWYSARKDRCIEQIWKVTCNLLDTGSDAVLELGLVRRGDRESFYGRVDGTGHELKIYVLDAPREVRRARVRDRNRRRGATFQMEVPEEIFDLADRAWQAPGAQECRERNIEIVATTGGHAIVPPANTVPPR
jgi:predicted kinase